MKFNFKLQTPKFNCFFFHLRVTNFKLKNWKLNFELLAPSRRVLKTHFYLCPLLLKGNREKSSLLFCSITKSIYPYIITGYCSQSLFSKWNLQVTKKPGTQK